MVLTRWQEARILNCVLKSEQHTRASAEVALINQHSAALQKIAMTLEREIKNGVQQLVSGADEVRESLTRLCDQIFLEGDAFIARKYWIARPDLTVAIAHRSWHMRDL